MFDTMYDEEIPYKKAGATVSGITPESFVSSSLFGAVTKEHKRSIYTVVDVINAHYGKGTLEPAVLYGNDTWTESKKLKSPEYTTRWEQIAKVKAV
jgi:DNA polymerase V